MGQPLSQRYAQQAAAEERSSLPLVIRAARVVVWIFYALVLVKVGLLLTAFVLRLLGANPEAGFTDWVYRSADNSMEPFRGIFPTREIGQGSELDASLLFAAIVYVVLAILLDLALRWLSSRLAEQQRRVQTLQQAARDAALAEYEAAQQAASQQALAQQAAAAAATATAAAARMTPPAVAATGFPPSPEPAPRPFPPPAPPGS
jgi:uncharacterized protein YggT (Ycf19 family)